jgi:pimeloyl-ACP methyl ester carboxylesterase
VSRRATVAAALILIVTACTRGSTSTTTTSPSPSPSPVTQSSILWSDCGGGFQCGSLTVPLDYSNPDKDTISIGLIRKRATDPTRRIGSLLINPGGPGASGIAFLRGSASGLSNLNRRFDLVGFDPRGVGQSAPVRCLDATREAAYNALDPVLDDPEEKQAALAADKEFGDGCQQLSARILPFVDTVSAAKDMDLMRAALGDPKLTYLGFSYGTFLGATYAGLFPTHIRALSLDGVVDPKLSAIDTAITQAAGFEVDLQAFLADCRSRASCTYGRSGDPGVKLNALMQRLDKNPLQVGSRQLTRGLALTSVAFTLYDTSFWPLLDQALTAADKGDGQAMLRLADLYYGEFSLDAFIVIECLDRPAPTDIAAYDALGPAFAKASPFFGPGFQYSSLQCAYLGVPATGQAGPISADGAPPILLVGGTNDPATPYSWAVSLHQQLTSSVLLTRSGNGHTSYGASICSQQAEDAYLINLTLPAEGTVCTT